MGDDGIWLSGPRDVEPEEMNHRLSMQFEQRRFFAGKSSLPFSEIG